MSTSAQCPFGHGAVPSQALNSARGNRDWWPEQLNQGILHQHSPKVSPMPAGFDYAKAFAELDLDAGTGASWQGLWPRCRRR